MNVNQIQCYFTQIHNAALGSTVDPDTDPTFIKLVDAAWEAMQQYQSDPSALNTQVVMQDVNALGVYFNGTAPDSSTQAYKVWQALQAPIDISGTTLLQGCQEFTDKTKIAAAVTFFMSTGGACINKSSALYAALNPYGSEKGDSGKPIAADIQTLYKDLDLFNQAQAMGDPAAAAALAPLVAADIKKVIADSSGVTDGYLTNIVTLLNTATTVGGSSLATLAAGSDPAAFLAALQSVGETGGSSGDLSSMIKNSCSNEGISL